jgi:hypothetical protein
MDKVDERSLRSGDLEADADLVPEVFSFLFYSCFFLTCIPCLPTQCQCREKPTESGAKQLEHSSAITPRSQLPQNLFQQSSQSSFPMPRSAGPGQATLHDLRILHADKVCTIVYPTHTPANRRGKPRSRLYIAHATEVPRPLSGPYHYRPADPMYAHFFS